MIIKNKTLDILLIVGGIGAVIFLHFASKSTRLFSTGFLAWEWPCYNDALLNVAAGCVTSIFFYYLLVRLPLSAQRKRLRQRLIHVYNEMRVAIMHELLIAVDRQNLDVKQLASNPVMFRETFHTGDRGSADEGWYAVANGLNECVVKNIKFELQNFRDELRSVLDKVDIENEELINLLKNLSVNILRMDQRGGNDHDDVKVWSGFLWSLYSNFFMDCGTLDHDPKLKILSKI